MPLYQKQIKSSGPLNHRQGSLLPLLLKVAERVIHYQNSVYLDHFISHKYQSISRLCLQYNCHHSTDLITRFDSVLFTRIILLNFQKAFTTFLIHNRPQNCNSQNVLFISLNMLLNGSGPICLIDVSLEALTTNFPISLTFSVKYFK